MPVANDAVDGVTVARIARVANVARVAHARQSVNSVLPRLRRQRHQRINTIKDRSPLRSIRLDYGTQCRCIRAITQARKSARLMGVVDTVPYLA